MFPRNAFDLFEQTRLWHWPWLFIQLVQLWAWMQDSRARLGEHVTVQFCVHEGRVYIIRMSDNLSGAKPEGPWTCGMARDLSHLTLMPAPAPAAPILRAVCGRPDAGVPAILHIAPG